MLADAFPPDNGPETGYRTAVIRLFALCGGYIELDRASMLDDLPAGPAVDGAR